MIKKTKKSAQQFPRIILLFLNKWMFIDSFLNPSRYRKVAASSLMIMDVKEKDHGSYQCRAENDEDTLDAVAEVNVQGMSKKILPYKSIYSTGL